MLSHTVSRSGAHIFRSPLRGRIFAGVIIVSSGALSIALTIIMLMNGTITGNPWAPANFAGLTGLILGLLALITLGVRIPFMRVRIRGQAVTITNVSRTYRINAAEITRITLEQRTLPQDIPRWVPRAYLAVGRPIWLADLHCGPAGEDPNPKRVRIVDELRTLAGMS